MAEENVTLYDPALNRIFNIVLSAEDAARAKTGIVLILHINLYFFK